MSETTLLALTGIGVPPYSARGLQQTLEVIEGDLRRTINGTLLNLTAPQLLKYRSQITGNDQQPPGCDGVWPGKEVLVDCIAELAHPEYTSPQRPMVPGSDREESGWIFYRPRLTMVVTALSMQRDEYGAMVSWTLNLEEK